MIRSEAHKNPLTLKCPCYFSLPFVHKGGGSLGPIHFWVLSRRNFGTNLHHMCIHPKQRYISKKNDQKMFCFIMAATKRIFVSRKKIKKTLSRRNFSIKFGSKLKNIKFFNKIWLKIEEHKIQTAWMSVDFLKLQ